MVKKCSKCGVEKPATREFFASYRQGVTPQCRACLREWQRQHWAQQQVKPREYDPTKLRECNRCHQIRPETLEFFAKRITSAGGLGTICRECTKAVQRQWRQRNQALLLSRQRARRTEKQAYIRKQMREWREKNIEHRTQYQRQYSLANRGAVFAKRGQRIKKRMDTDPAFAIARRLRSRVLLALRGIQKMAPTFELLGCTRSELLAHLAAQMPPGCSIEDRKSYEVDHIVPCASFDLRDEAEQKKCFHYSNLQPLPPRHNYQKNRAIGPEWGNYDAAVALLGKQRTDAYIQNNMKREVA